MTRATISKPLAAANLVAVALVIWPWIRETAPAPTPQPRGEAEAPKLARLAPFTDFATILERPLFSPSRRPSAVVKPATIAIESRYRLQGIITVGGAWHAIIAPVAGGAGLELGEGDALEGWSVKSIVSDHVVLASPAGEATLALAHAGAAANGRR